MAFTERDLHKVGEEIMHHTIAIDFIETDELMAYVRLQVSQIILKMAWVNLVLQKADLKAKGNLIYASNLLVQLEMGIKQVVT